MLLQRNLPRILMSLRLSENFRNFTSSGRSSVLLQKSTETRSGTASRQPQLLSIRNTRLSSKESRNSRLRILSRRLLFARRSRKSLKERSLTLKSGMLSLRRSRIYRKNGRPSVSHPRRRIRRFMTASALPVTSSMAASVISIQNIRIA